jgi:hypothetical protein
MQQLSTTGAKSIMRWLYAAHKKLINVTRLLVEPENEELLKHADKRHHHCILPPLENVVGAARGSIGADDNFLCQLIGTTNRSNNVARIECPKANETKVVVINMILNSCELCSSLK